MNDRKSTGKVLITGATRGIGLACASLLHERGQEVVGLARSDDCDAFPGELFTVDLSDREATRDCLQRLDGQFCYQPAT